MLNELLRYFLSCGTADISFLESWYESYAYSETSISEYAEQMPVMGDFNDLLWCIADDYVRRLESYLDNYYAVRLLDAVEIQTNYSCSRIYLTGDGEDYLLSIFSRETVSQIENLLSGGGDITFPDGVQLAEGVENIFL